MSPGLVIFMKHDERTEDILVEEHISRKVIWKIFVFCALCTIPLGQTYEGKCMAILSEPFYKVSR